MHSSSAEDSLAPSSSAAEPSGVPEAAATPEPESTPEQASSVGTDVEAEIQDFIDTYVAAQIDAMSETLQESGMSIDIFARGNSLVYSFQYHVDVGDTKLVKEELEAELDSTASIYEEVLSTIEMLIPEAESVVIEHLDMDGNVIVSKEFAESE